jgi:hypothetical protein
MSSPVSLSKSRNACSKPSRVSAALMSPDACRSLLEWLMKIAGIAGCELPRLAGLRLANATPGETRVNQPLPSVHCRGPRISAISARMPASPDIVQAPRTVRLKTLVALRWFAVLGQAVAVLVVHYGLEFEVPLAACLVGDRAFGMAQCRHAHALPQRAAACAAAGARCCSATTSRSSPC